jgi:hypothetical protein
MTLSGFYLTQSGWLRSRVVRSSPNINRDKDTHLSLRSTVLSALADDKVGSSLRVLGHRPAVHISIHAPRAERIALVAVRLDLGGVGVEKSQAVSLIRACEDLKLNVYC